MPCSLEAAESERDEWLWSVEKQKRAEIAAMKVLGEYRIYVNRSFPQTQNTALLDRDYLFCARPISTQEYSQWSAAATAAFACNDQVATTL